MTPISPSSLTLQSMRRFSSGGAIELRFECISREDVLAPTFGGLKSLSM
jgi:hypothetical protein